MKEQFEDAVSEIDFKEDSNNNGIPDWLEFITTYGLVALCVYIILAQNPSESLIKWLITISGILTGGRDWLKGRLS